MWQEAKREGEERYNKDQRVDLGEQKANVSLKHR